MLIEFFLSCIFLAKSCFLLIILINYGVCPSPFRVQVPGPQYSLTLPPPFVGTLGISAAHELGWTDVISNPVVYIIIRYVVIMYFMPKEITTQERVKLTSESTQNPYAARMPDDVCDTIINCYYSLSLRRRRIIYYIIYYIVSIIRD